MSEKLDYLIGNSDRLKEIQRIQYDYFKHLTTLSVGALGVIAALALRVLSGHKGTAFLIISIVALLLCLLESLWVLAVPGNAFLNIIGIQLYAESSSANSYENRGKAEKAATKFGKALDQISLFDKFTKIVFLLGIAAFMIYIWLKLLATK